MSEPGLQPLTTFKAGYIHLKSVQYIKCKSLCKPVGGAKAETMTCWVRTCWLP